MHYTKKEFTTGKYKVLEVAVSDEYFYFIGDKNITDDVQRYSQIVQETEEAIEMAVEDFMNVSNNIQAPKYCLTIIQNGSIPPVLVKNLFDEVIGMEERHIDGAISELDEYGQYKIPLNLTYEMVVTFGSVINQIGLVDGEQILTFESEEIIGDELISVAIANVLERYL